MIDDLNYEKRVGKQNKVKQRHGSVKKKKKKGPNDFSLYSFPVLTQKKKWLLPRNI